MQLLVKITPNVTLPLVRRLCYRTLIGRKAAPSHLSSFSRWRVCVEFVMFTITIHFDSYINLSFSFPWKRWATGYGLDYRGFGGFDSRRRVGIFLFSTASRTALGPSQPPI